jgi:23S rRNA (adenine1618-N6)-methyltransferase
MFKTHTSKSGLHPRNKHRNNYDFKQLIVSCPDLAKYVLINKYDNESIDFFNPNAVKVLNKALLKHFYSINNWDIPHNFLTPPIPGRADYIHNIADLLAGSNNDKIPKGNKIKCLDIGVGANCIYPIIGNIEYGWMFIGSDIDEDAINAAASIIEQNKPLVANIELRLQQNRNDIFNGVINRDEFIDVTICNPPFHASAAEARKGTIRKISNLKKKTVSKPVLNFGGQNNELWCKGGEKQFVKEMIFQSKSFSKSCLWFTTLISKESNLVGVYKLLQKVAAADVKTIPMSQGNKSSRIVAWTYFGKKEQSKWAKRKWL